MTKKNFRPIPRFATPIIETHCHLDYLMESQFDSDVDAAVSAGIERLITIAVSRANLSVVRGLAERSSRVWCTQGIHPHEAGSWSTALLDEVRQGASHDKVVAIGEIGLDYYYDHADRVAQRDAFESQLALAAELNLPVVIHTRDADNDTRSILENALPVLSKRGVIHSFTSSPALAQYCLDEGFSLGFNGICTFKNAENVRDVIRMTPLNRILLETDTPYLTPEPYRGRVNHPKFLPFIAEKIAELKNIEVEVLLTTVKANSEELFFTAL
jgi:TatD DNase family protein